MDVRIVANTIEAEFFSEFIYCNHLKNLELLTSCLKKGNYFCDVSFMNTAQPELCKTSVASHALIFLFN